MRAAFIRAAAGCGLVLIAALGATAGSAAPAETPANVSLGLPSDVPLRLVNFSFDNSRPGMLAFHYDVKNFSGQGLVAVEISWQAQFGEKAPTSISNLDDRWLTGQLAAGGAEHFQVSNVPNPGSAPLARLVASVSYAEFEDGSRLGANAAERGKSVDAGRRATLASYLKFLDTFNKSGSEAMAQAIRVGSVTSATRQLPAVQEANARLLGILTEQGVDAVVLELQRVSTLPLPEPRA